ncbi:MAG: serine/threonine protein kinase [Polyangiaceae bacterium]|nr:serine/threonine protein kinase [Polyangiaceae bacterium]
MSATELDEAEAGREASESSGAGPVSERAAIVRCPRCGNEAAPLSDGGCARCRSLVAARTLPQGVSLDLDRLAISKLGDAPVEAETPAHRVDPLIGLVIADRYRILEPLGRGGMGIVYKVEHVRIGKLLAMKLLAGELSRNQDVVRRFKTEALTASKLSSPNTVQVFDYGVSEGLTYLVMELVNGDDLGRLLKVHGLLPASRLGRIAVQIANSLAEAHATGIVHRDVKPENVMILKARDGTDLAKVLDFGLAKIREGSELSELTSQGAIVGTPYFMSPEQIRGEQVDPRSDIYSLGALMYRALTGTYPFNGPSPMSVFAKHLTEEPQAPHLVTPSVPVGLSDIVMRALRKDPGERFQRIEDLQTAVVAELSELGTSGIEALLDSGALRRLEKPAQATSDKDAFATRDEVEAYERKLRRTRLGISVLVATLPLAGIGAGAHYLLQERAVQFGGVEIEPNDEFGQATEIPYGESIRAMLGKRRSASESDLDFFRVEIPQSPAGSGQSPADKLSRLTMTPLPNIPLCLQVFRKGETRPSAQYCTGRPGLELDIPAVKLDSGEYYLAVIQDLDAYGDGRAPFIHENVSDEYTLRLGPGESDASLEVEPNDEVSSAQPISIGATLRGTLAWVKDVDVYCPKVESTSAYRFRIEDEPREAGIVLSVALAQGGSIGTGVRVHADSEQKLTATDAPSPYTGFSFRGFSPPCLVVQAAIDPFFSKDAIVTKRDAVPRGSRAYYRVTLEPAP